MGQPLGQVTIKGSESFPLLLLDSAIGDRLNVGASLVGARNDVSGDFSVAMLLRNDNFAVFARCIGAHLAWVPLSHYVTAPLKQGSNPGAAWIKCRGRPMCLP